MKRIAAVCAFVLLSAEGAYALSVPVQPHAAEQRPCMADVNHYCHAVINDLGRRITCLQAHRTQLTAVCRAKMEAFEAKMGPIAAQHHLTLAQFMVHQQEMMKRDPLHFHPVQVSPPPVPPHAMAAPAKAASSSKPATPQ